MLVPHEHILVALSGVLVAVIVGILTFYKWKFGYWKRRGLFYLKPSFPFGTMENPLSRTLSLGVWVKRNYDELKSLHLKHGGLYNFLSPVYLPVDPDYIRNVMSNDFNHFADRGFYYNEKEDPLSAHLFSIDGKKWKNLRPKFTPAFSSGKMKIMFETMLKCSEGMLQAMDQLAERKQCFDIKEIASRYTTDVIGSTAFGLECNSFKNPDAEFAKFGKKAFMRNKFSALKYAFLLTNPEIGRKLGMRIIEKDVREFFTNIVKQTVDYRQTNNFVRNDMLQILIDMKNLADSNNSANDAERLTLNELTAHVFVFFSAGFETSSSLMAHFIFEVARNQKIQKKVREEINRVLNDYEGKITYESLKDLKYMDQVMDETLRKYPVLSVIQRRCTKKYRVPDTDVLLEKGTDVLIPTVALHYDAEYFPNPHKFDPERFSKENRKKIRPFTYLPYGEGPRICIGIRFGILQTKIGLTRMLKNYKFTVNTKTDVPLKINTFSMAHKFISTLWLDAEKIY